MPTPRYTVVYTNPNNVVRTEPYTANYDSLAEVRELVKRAREYPGSYRIVSMTKNLKSGSVPLVI